MNIATARTTVTGLLDPVPRLHVYPKPPGSPNTPAAIVYPASGEATVVFESTEATTQMTVLVLVQIGSNEQAHDDLDALLDVEDPASILGLLAAADDAVGGVSWDSFGDVEYAGVTYLGAQIHLEVF